MRMNCVGEQREWRWENAGRRGEGKKEKTEEKKEVKRKKGKGGKGKQCRSEGKRIASQANIGQSLKV